MIASAASIGGVVFAVLYVAALVFLAVMNALKGKWWFALLAVIPFSVLGAILGAVGAIRLAKPQSRWARERYGDVKIAESLERFGSATGRFPGSPPREVTPRP